MRKYIVQHLKGVTSILEIECEKVTLLEDPSLAWSLKNFEYKVKVSKPVSFAGEILCWWALFATEPLARQQAEKELIEEAKRNARKEGRLFTVPELGKILQKVKELSFKEL